MFILWAVSIPDRITKQIKKKKKDDISSFFLFFFFIIINSVF